MDAGFLLRCARFRRWLFLGDLFESFDTFPDDIGGNGESEALSRNALRSEGHLRRADPDKAAGEIDQRAAAVPRINRGVGLEQVLVIVVVDRDVALHAAENAAADRAAVAERVADHDDGLAKEIRRDVVQIDEGERLVAVDLDEGEVLLRVARDVARLETLIVVRDDLDFQIGGALHDVLVRHDVAARDRR